MENFEKAVAGSGTGDIERPEGGRIRVEAAVVLARVSTRCRLRQPHKLLTMSHLPRVGSPDKPALGLS
eukprot:765542-Hanusia_phi.AAC.3